MVELKGDDVELCARCWAETAHEQQEKQHRPGKQIDTLVDLRRTMVEASGIHTLRGGKGAAMESDGRACKVHLSSGQVWVILYRRVVP